MNSRSYETVIIGGAVVGSSVAYWLSENPDYNEKILVIEPDPTYQYASTTLSEASIRHQFSQPINIRLSQFSTEFFDDFHEYVQVEGESPSLSFRETGYLFLATQSGMRNLESNHEIQVSCGAEVSLLDPNDLNEHFPYLYTEDLAGASLGLRHEGSLDPYSLMKGFQQRARSNGVEYLTDRVVGLHLSKKENRITKIQLASGEFLECNWVVNCAGPRAREIATMANLMNLPVSAGGVCLSVEALYKITFSHDSLN